jgi:hypothetical protein
MLPVWVIVGVLTIGGMVTAGVTYYFTPKYTRVGYTPSQPVPFSHKIHAGQLGIVGIVTVLWRSRGMRMCRRRRRVGIVTSM